MEKVPVYASIFNKGTGSKNKVCKQARPCLDADTSEPNKTLQKDCRGPLSCKCDCPFEESLNKHMDDAGNGCNDHTVITIGKGTAGLCGEPHA
eukprot:1148692-Pelagomonas_calceolata.AAC.4